MIQGKLLGIATRTKSRAPMQEFESIEVSIDRGCVGDFRGSAGARQVTVLSREAWETVCDEIGQSLPWTDRRANLLVEGLELAETESCEIRIGEVRLRITRETDPCGRMVEVASGLREALTPQWRGGVCCRVIQGGHIAVGDAIVFATPLDATLAESRQRY